ncbi:MAG: hypothetical protein J5849_02295, partial [Clostridia bacterium]|nr:hypothetical protein [Clostridia bacterium]
GLIRAYAQGARLAVEGAGKARMTRMQKLRVVLPYHLYGKAASKLSRMDLSPEEPAFSDAVSFFLTVLPAAAENVGNELRDLSAGQAVIEEAGEVWIPFPEE